MDRALKSRACRARPVRPASTRRPASAADPPPHRRPPCRRDMAARRSAGIGCGRARALGRGYALVIARSPVRCSSCQPGGKAVCGDQAQQRIVDGYARPGCRRAPRAFARRLEPEPRRRLGSRGQSLATRLESECCAKPRRRSAPAIDSSTRATAFGSSRTSGAREERVSRRDARGEGDRKTDVAAGRDDEIRALRRAAGAGFARSPSALAAIARKMSQRETARQRTCAAIV